MSHSISSGYNRDILGYILSFLGNQEKITLASVCKNWKETATAVCRLRCLLKANEIENELNQKMTVFLKMTGKKSADYCPLFEEIRKDQGELSLSRICTIYDQLNTLMDRRIKKYEVSLGESFLIDPQSIPVAYEHARHDREILETVPCMQLPKLREVNFQELSNMLSKETQALEFFKQPFISFHFTFEKGYCMWIEQILYPQQTYCEREVGGGYIAYFPIGLFNLKMQEGDHQLIGEKNQGSYCFPLKGNLMEFTIIPEAINQNKATYSYISPGSFSLSHVVSKSLNRISVGNYHLAVTELFYDPGAHAHPIL